MRDMIRTTVGEAVKAQRKRRKLSQQCLAELAGVQKNTILHLEKGRHSPRVCTLMAIAKALGVHPGLIIPD